VVEEVEEELQEQVELDNLVDLVVVDVHQDQLLEDLEILHPLLPHKEIMVLREMVEVLVVVAVALEPLVDLLQ
jgi:hypothetical protein